MTDSTSPLRALLGAGEWQAADLETRRLLIAQADTGGYAGIDPDEAATVECALLCSIDEATNGPAARKIIVQTEGPLSAR